MAVLDPNVELAKQAMLRYQGAVPAPVQMAPPVAPPIMDAPAPTVADPGMQLAPLDPALAPVELPPAAPLPMQDPGVQVAPVVDVDPASVTNSRAALADMGTAAGGQAQALMDKTAAEQEVNAAQADGLVADADLLQEQARRHEERQAERASFTQKYMDDAKAADERADRLEAAGPAKKTWQQRVLGIFATAMTGLADGLSGYSGRQTNFANELQAGIDKAAAADLQRQKDLIASERGKSSRAMSSLAQYRDFFKDDTAADEYDFQKRREAGAAQAKALALKSSNKVVQAEGVGAADKILGDAKEKQAQILSSQENARFMAQAANARVEKTAATAYRPGSTSQAVLEAKEKDKTITADETQELEQIRTAIANRNKPPAGSKGGLSEGQAKAQALFEGSEADAKRVEAALSGKKLPGAAIARAAESPFVPDAAIPEGAEVYRSARALVNDVLRDESGASIGAAEKDELLNGLKSTDPTVREQAYVRVLAKRAAMGAKVPAKIVAGGKAVQADIAPDTMVRFSLDGRVGLIPAGQAAEFQKKHPTAQRL